MNIMLAWGLGGMEVLLIFAVVLLLFGAKKLPELAKGLGSGIKEFKKATREVTDEIHNAAEVPPAQPKYTPITQPQPQPQSPSTVAQTINNPKV